jgi:ABC-type Fe3+/spermidine/putrescine transport system ATPase subunit
MPAVELLSVRKSFGNTLVVDDVSLAIQAGEFFSLLGSSGCGKSTTLRLIAGFERADAGEIRVGGRTAGSGEPAYAKQVNMVFQNYALFPHMDVAENVAFGLRMAGMNRPDREKKTREMLSVVRLEGLESRMPSQLSGGQQQRVALARAMATDPQVVLLDEPLGALDLKLRREMQYELKRIQRERSLTFVYVTHDQEEALSMSDRLCVMHHGRAMQTGTPQEIYGRPACRFIAEFIGDNNLLPAGDGKLLAIRPEEIRICPEGTEDAGPSACRGTVIETVFQGADCVVSVQLSGGEVLRVRRSGRFGAVPPGTAVELLWPEDAACLLKNDP